MDVWDGWGYQGGEAGMVVIRVGKVTGDWDKWFEVDKGLGTLERRGWDLSCTGRPSSQTFCKACPYST